MQTTVKLGRCGNSACARLNNSLLAIIGANINNYVDVFANEKNHSITIKKHNEGPKTLAELLDGWQGDFETTSVMDDGNLGAEIG
ncbi:MAG: hypothetical protein LBT37_05070 [Lactobacillaceae bacterium]|nr:hypothetical protein [Lactobacillaceae bacterium]